MSHPGTTSRLARMIEFFMDHPELPDSPITISGGAHPNAVHVQAGSRDEVEQYAKIFGSEVNEHHFTIKGQSFTAWETRMPYETKPLSISVHFFQEES